LSATSNE
jgi:hypothetical protein